MGPVLFDIGPNHRIEAHGEDKKQILDALHLLYFAANAHKAYYDQAVDPLNNYFENGTAVSTHFALESIDSTVFQAFSKLLAMTADPAEKTAALHVVQAIKCLNESMALTSSEPWHAYLLLSKGFDVLFSLNPTFPAADLRQHMRPLLHLKFSHPVELLWKWVDRFYASSHAAMAGELLEDPLFNDNPNVKTPILLIAEKLLIFSIYDTLFAKKLLIGAEGTPSTPDDFKHVHPERVLVYFWTLDTLSKKIELLNFQQDSPLDLTMLTNIQEMHQKLQRKGSSKETFQGEFGP